MKIQWANRPPCCLVKIRQNKTKKAPKVSKWPKWSNKKHCNTHFGCGFPSTVKNLAESSNSVDFSTFGTGYLQIPQKNHFLVLAQPVGTLDLQFPQYRFAVQCFMFYVFHCLFFLNDLAAEEHAGTKKLKMLEFQTKILKAPDFLYCALDKKVSSPKVDSKFQNL